MKSITEYILEYKQRRTTGFNYTKIEQAIKNCKPKLLGNNVCIDILWTPEIYFNYNGGWSAGKPDDAFHGGKHYNGITLGDSSVMFIDFFAAKNIFKKNTLEGYISWMLPSKINDDDTNLDEIKKYLDSKSNYTVNDEDGYPAQKKIKFTSYEELEKYLKEIEDIINKHNTKCDKNEPTYLYFDKTEASLNAQFKKNQYEIISCEEKIVELNKKLEDIKKAEESTDTDLSELKTSIENQINILKKLKEKNK